MNIVIHQPADTSATIMVSLTGRYLHITIVTKFDFNIEVLNLI